MMDDENGILQNDLPTAEGLSTKYPNRPYNHSATLPFHELITVLFNPLLENRKKPTRPNLNRKKIGPHTRSNAPNEIRKDVIQRFITRWRQHVGPDIYPAFRLIMPDKDRDRAMYGLKDKTIGKLLVQVMKITKDSEDGLSLLNWKLPGTKASMAGDFAGRCYEVLKKRPFTSKWSKLSVGEVNDMLDQLSVAQKEVDQKPIFDQFYQQMCPEELLWLIRMILRQMKIGATEKTILDVWHPDAEDLFNVSSSLRRVCWELWQPELRLTNEESELTLMQCFQPQLAAFQMHNMDKMVERMKMPEDDPVFWIEEKLDGERMQLHMIEDANKAGGKRFCFWSRKAKDYTYLYGDSFEDPNGALTRHLKNAFAKGVRNIILDGEMITWQPKEDRIASFGTLKTAALSEQKNPFQGGDHPFFVVFDCLYLNDKPLTDYTLRDRHMALEKSVVNNPYRIEKHKHVEATNAKEVEVLLRKVVAESTEGLVLKNPRSLYRLNDRNDDWMKVKPEYMTEFGDALDCVVIGGYYGSGRRGGKLSSFLCGLRPSKNDMAMPGVDPVFCLSFFKVGGGMTATDYSQIHHLTEGKWHKWDPAKPPEHLIKLGGGSRQLERPDMWIRADESVVLEVKAASVHATEQFATNLTLRFPRFRKLRQDKDWRTALDFDEFIQLKQCAQEAQEDKKFQIDDARRKNRQSKKRVKRETVIAGQEAATHTYQGPKTRLFENRSFYVLSEQVKPRQSKAEIEDMIKTNGGEILQTDKDPSTIIVSDRNVVKAAAIKKAGKRIVVRPKWLYDCVRQAQIDADFGQEPCILPLEPDDVLFGPEEQLRKLEASVDEFGDSYTKDITLDVLMALMDKMDDVEPDSKTLHEVRQLVDAI